MKHTSILPKTVLSLAYMFTSCNIYIKNILIENVVKFHLKTEQVVWDDPNLQLKNQ